MCDRGDNDRDRRNFPKQSMMLMMGDLEPSAKPCNQLTHHCTDKKNAEPTDPQLAVICAHVCMCVCDRILCVCVFVFGPHYLFTLIHSLLTRNANRHTKTHICARSHICQFNMNRRSFTQTTASLIRTPKNIYFNMFLNTYTRTHAFKNDRQRRELPKTARAS